MRQRRFCASPRQMAAVRQSKYGDAVSQRHSTRERPGSLARGDCLRVLAGAEWTARLRSGEESERPRLSIKAREVVFAAGAIESTRLLLLVDRQHDDRLFEPHGILGCYFYDHLSVPTSRVFVRDARRLNQITGFRFEGKTMRNLRFEPSFELRKQHGLPTRFAHISFV